MRSCFFCGIILAYEKKKSSIGIHGSSPYDPVAKENVKMKKKTRILSLLLAAVFCMSLTQAAFCLAEENQPDRDSI